MNFNKFEKIQATPKEIVKTTNIVSRIKKLVIGALIVGNLSPSVMAGNDNISKDKSENKKENTKGHDSKVTESEDKVEFKATNFFKPDSDQISPEAINDICLNFQKLLNEIDQDNYNQVLEQGIVVSPGADQNSSVQFKNNEELAKARAKALITFLDDYLQKANFPNLAIEEVKNLKEKIQFIIEIPVSAKVENPQIGVIYPEDLGYTKEELNKMDQSQIDEIYKACRVVTVSLGLEIKKGNTYFTRAGDFINMMEAKKVLKQEESNENIKNGKVDWNAKSIMVTVDKSPSVNQKTGNHDLSWQVVLQKITDDSTLIKKEINFAFFSDKLEQMETYTGIDSVVDVVKNGAYIGSSKEQAVSCALKSIENFPNDKESKIFKTFTDESLQNVSLQMILDLDKMCIDKNINAKFYFINKDKKLMEFSVWEIRKLTEKAIFDGIEGKFNNFIVSQRNRGGLNKKDKAENNEKINELITYFNDCEFENFFNDPLIAEMYKGSNEIKKDPFSYFSKKVIPNVSLEGYGRIIDLN